MRKSNLVKEAVCGVNVELSTADMWTLTPLAERINIYLKVARWRGGRYNRDNDAEKWAQECGFKSEKDADQAHRNNCESQFHQDVDTLMKFVNKLTTDIPKSNIFDED